YPSSKFLLWAHSRVAACGSRAMSNTSAGCPTAKYEALSRAFRSHEAGTADAPRRVRLTGWLLYDSYVGQIPLALDPHGGQPRERLGDSPCHAHRGMGRIAEEDGRPRRPLTALAGRCRTRRNLISFTAVAP